jgi:hypothetical protein
MKRALEDIISKRMDYKKVARSFHVLQSSLEDRAKKANQGMSTVNASHSCRRARKSAQYMLRQPP